jgi:telomerase reverse transcriptase
LATPDAHVSAFCRAVMKKVVPKECWGFGLSGEENEQIIMQNVDRFIRARKLESFTLHEMLQGLKVGTCLKDVTCCPALTHRQIGSIPWLCQEYQRDSKMSVSDFEKRKQLFAEFVYYVFDSFLIPLVRSNFYVTESNVHRNRLFYFRHDVWRTISEPAMAALRRSMFEELDTEKARKRLTARQFGFSHIRLLPKAVGFRPITNLRRRPQYWQNGKRVLGRSINSFMVPAFRVLNYEKAGSYHQAL